MRVCEVYAVTCHNCHGEIELEAKPIDQGKPAICSRCGTHLNITPTFGRARLLGVEAADAVA